MRVHLKIGLIIILVILAILANLGDNRNFLENNVINEKKKNTTTTSEIINTTINVYTNKIEVSEGESLFFVFEVLDIRNNYRIEDGFITITDLQTGRSQNFSFITESNSGLYENISWVISSNDIPSGWHTFNFKYNGFIDSVNNKEYLACSREINILILDSWIYENGNPILMNISNLSTKYIQGNENSLEVSLNSFKNSYFRIKSYITAIDMESKLILGKRIFSDDLSEYIVTWQDNFKLNISIPNFLSLGSHDIRVFYSGSAYVCDHKYVYEDIQILVTGDAYQIDLSLSESTIERSNDFEDYNVDFSVDLIGSEINNGYLEINLYHSTDSSIDRIFLYTGVGISTFNKKLLFSQLNSSVGDYIIVVNFTILREIYNDSIIVSVIDDTNIDLHTNNFTVSPGDELFIYGWVNEEDIPTNSVNGTINLYFGSNNHFISSILCNLDGYFTYYWLIPDNFTAQVTDLFALFFPSDSNYLSCESEKIEITISKAVNVVVYCLSDDIVTRGDTLQFQVQVIDENIIITDGVLSLASNYINESTFTCQETIISDEMTLLSWIIPNDFPIGINTFIISYSGYECYQNATRLYNIRILANSIIVDVSINGNDFTQGSTLEISGKLVEENNLSICNQIIEIWEDQKLLEEIFTNNSGLFSFLFTILTDYPLGFHDWQLIYRGDNQYYNEISSLVTISFKVNPIISLTIPPDINAGEILLLNITGRIYSQISILWKENSWNFWIEIDLITLNSEGIDFVKCDIPSDIFGLFEFKIVDIESQDFVISEIKVYSVPKITLFVNNDIIVELIVGDTLFLTVNSTEQFDIWFNGGPIGNRLTGTHNYPIIINDKGLQNITVHSYDVYARSVKKELLLVSYEMIDYDIHIIDYPDFKENELIKINCSFSSELSGDIEGLPICIINNNSGMVIYSTYTNEAGIAFLQFSLACDYYTLVIFTPKYDNFLAINYELNIVVWSQAKMIIEPISAHTEQLIDIEVILTSYYGNPLVNESVSLKIYDSKTDKWLNIGENKTDFSGKVSIKWIVSILPGDYNILAIYNGSALALGVQSASILYIKTGEGPRVIFTNYEIDNSVNLDSDQVVTVNLLVMIESKVSMQFVIAIINNSEYIMNESVSEDADTASVNFIYTLSLILTKGEYNWTIIATNSLNISSYWLKSINIGKNKNEKSNDSFFFVFFSGLSLLSFSLIYFEYKRRFN